MVVYGMSNYPTIQMGYGVERAWDGWEKVAWERGSELVDMMAP